ncbi:MAG: alpha-ribazole phosphatase [Bacillota bacterium]
MVAQETELILMRHGETEWNKNYRFQGQKDIELNKKGINQALKAARFLALYDLDIIYCSKLKRAVKTASIINKEHNISLEKKSYLNEITFGDWEGLTYNEIEEKYSDKLKKWNNDPWNNSPPEGETLKKFQTRIIQIQKDIIENNRGKTILTVSHGGVIKVFLAYILNMPPENYWQFNTTSTGISKVKFYGEKAIIEFINSQPHLSDAK